VANTLAIRLGRSVWSIIKQYVLENRPFWFFVVFGALSTVLLWYLTQDKAGPGEGWVGNTAVEGFGFLMDIILFGLLWSIFDVYRERRVKIRGYHDELKDFLWWGEEEGVLRKTGIIKRLNELRATLPDMSYIFLEKADLHRVYFKGTNLENARFKGAIMFNANLEGVTLGAANLENTHLMWSNFEGANLELANLEGTDLKWANLQRTNMIRSNLKGANLQGVHLKGANLERTNFEGASLQGAKGLSWDQLKNVKTDNETVLPVYLRENKPDWYKGKFAEEKEEEE
jgi:hypothetical protein